MSAEVERIFKKIEYKLNNYGEKMVYDKGSYKQYPVTFELSSGEIGEANVFSPDFKAGDKVLYTFKDGKYHNFKKPQTNTNSSGGFNKAKTGGNYTGTADATVFAGVCGAAGELIAAGKLDIKHFDSFVENKFNLYKKLTAQTVPEPVKPQPSEQRFSEPAAKMQVSVAQEPAIGDPTADLPF